MKKALRFVLTLKFLKRCQTLLSDNTFPFCELLNMHSKAKMEVSRLYNINYLQCHQGIIPCTRECVPRGVAVRDGSVTHMNS